MPRVLVPALAVGSLTLSDAASHHLRDVLRAQVGDAVEPFTPAGDKADATIAELRPSVVIQVKTITPAAPSRSLIVASAVPKGDRADSMVEKLCEIGVTTFIPLRTARSVVHPEGAGKLSRWQRIAAEAARQSHRSGVMVIEELAALPTVVERFTGQFGMPLIPPPTPPGDASKPAGIFLSTGQDVQPLLDIHMAPYLLLIGPEGGWTDNEESMMLAAGLTPASLGPTILRIETAAVVAAGVARLMHR